MQPPGYDQYHSQLLQNIGDQVYLNAAFFYQNLINLVTCFPIRRSQSVFMNAAMFEHCTLDRVFDVRSLLL